MKLKERYILWRLTPAEQLIYRMLQHPEEWKRDDYDQLQHRKTGVCICPVRDDPSRLRVRMPIDHYNFLEVVPERFARKRLHKLASFIRWPPPPTSKELQRMLFERLMKAELGEKP